MLQNLDEADRFLNVLTKFEQQLDRFLNLHWKDKHRGFSTVDFNLFPLLKISISIKKDIFAEMEIHNYYSA